MHWGLVKTIILLPGTVLVFIPAVILLTTRDSEWAPEPASPAQVWFWMALLAAIVGLALSAWTATLFLKFGEGTPAPWDPPKRWVVRGPYRHVRNPMITGVLLILFAEAVLLLGLLVLYVRSQSVAGSLLVGFALLGSLMVSYLRARIEAQGIECKVGLFTRTERVIILALGLLFSQFDYALIIALAIIVVFSFFTVGQRLFYAWRQTGIS